MNVPITWWTPPKFKSQPRLTFLPNEPPRNWARRNWLTPARLINLLPAKVSAIADTESQASEAPQPHGVSPCWPSTDGGGGSG